MVNYRIQARNHLKSAKGELGANSDQRLKYAALELRMAMECLTYDRALAYKDEFPPEEYETWQPNRVMSVLLEIDPSADQDYSLYVGEKGEALSDLRPLGSETVLSMRMLKHNYSALGSYLHVLLMKQARAGVSQDFPKMRKRCDEIAAFIDRALASRVFNVTLGSFAAINCMECGKPLRKRLPMGQEQIRAKCYECNADYTIVKEGDGNVLWKPHQQKAKCANPDCQEKIVIWEHEITVGRYWTCGACQGTNTVVHTLKFEAPKP